MIRFLDTHSIKFRMMAIFVFIIGMMVLSFWISFSRQNVINHEYQRFMENNTLISELPLLINDASRQFSSYFNSREREVLTAFRETNQKINHTLFAIRIDAQNDKHSSVFYRTLANMHEYQLKHSEILFKADTLNVNVYEEWAYLRNLYSYMNEQSQQLSISYLEYSGTQYGSLLENSKKLERSMYFIIGIFALASVFFAVILSNGIFKKIGEISKVAKMHAHRANWDTPDIKPSKYIELDNVAQAFNRMKISMQHYILEIKEKAKIEKKLINEQLHSLETEKLLKESELLSLQMQMNPHFLFNTLNMIGRTAMLKQNDITIELIESMSQILRYNLDNRGNTVPLYEELNALKAYIYIQEMRFQDRMSFVLKTDGNIDDVHVPPMILQPIVENSIIHGLKDKEEDGKVCICVQRKETYVAIQLFDNGTGFNENERLQPSTPHKKRSIGLSIVKERLELYYGQTNLVQIDSTPKHGTTVTLTIPFMKDGVEIDTRHDR